MKKKVIEFFLIIIGIALIAYPIISNFLNLYSQVMEINKYQEQVKKLTEEQKREELEKQQEYNKKLGNEGSINISLEENDGKEKEQYKNIFDFESAIAYISIPKIDVLLPIYEGTSTEALKKGVGHLEDTSLPIGGKGNHSVLAGHTALIGKVIFDNIDKLQIGDTFYIYNLNEVLKYEVDNIKIVEPYDRDAITIDAEKDFVTLLTCTPYGVGSHRLLVRGERVEETEDIQQTDDSTNEEKTNELQKAKYEIEQQIQKLKKDSLQKFILTIIIIAIILIATAIMIFKKHIQAKRYK